MRTLEEIRKEPVTVALILINVLIFIAVELTGTSQDAWHVLNYGAAYTPYIVEKGEVYRLFTSMFLHFGIEHLVNNMLVLFVLGSRLEQVIGKIRFVLIYLLGGIAGNILSLVLELRSQEFSVSAGASGAVFAVMGAMIYVVIRNKGWLGDLSMRQVLVMAAFSLYFGFTSSGVDNAAHVGGMIAGFVIAVRYTPKSTVFTTCNVCFFPNSIIKILQCFLLHKLYNCIWFTLLVIQKNRCLCVFHSARRADHIVKSCLLLIFCAHLMDPEICRQIIHRHLDVLAVIYMMIRVQMMLLHSKSLLLLILAR